MLKRGSLSTRNFNFSTQELQFKAVDGVDYTQLDAVLANPAANDQLLVVMSTQHCSENLLFLNALARLRACDDAQNRASQLNELFSHWIDADALNTVNIEGATRLALFDALDSGVDEFDPQGTGDCLLDAAQTQIKRLMSGPLRELQSKCTHDAEATGCNASPTDHLLQGIHENQVN